MTYSLFSYKKGDSLLHRCPAWCKILFIPLINILFLCLPWYFSAVLVVIQFIVACCLHFTLKEQFTDLKPVLYYAFLLLLFQLFSFKLPEPSLFITLVKLFAVMQSASLMFKTSTSLQLREGIGVVFGHNSLITNALSMFMNFLPMISQIWAQSKRAWFARGGKNGIKMYGTLLPVLFSVGMKKAWNASRVLAIRNKN